MKKLLKVLSVVLSSLLVSTAFSACGKKPASTNDASSSSGAPFQISIFFDGPNTNCDRNNTQLIRAIEKATNTKIKITEAPSGQGNAKLNLLISSGEVPMIVKAGNNIINKYGIEGAMWAMDDVVNKYMPNAKKYLTKNVNNLLLASDNKLYTIPLIRDTGYGAFFIRQDWLDKLGLQAPKTLDDYYNVLKAFTKNDPDGDGKADTFGTSMNENLGKFELMAGPFGITAGQDFIPSDDGSLTIGSVAPKMKDALAFGQKLYKESLMNQEFGTLKGPQYDELVTNNKIGVMYNYSSGTMKLQGILQKTVPNAKYNVIDVPTAPGVKKGISCVSTIIENTNGKSINGYVGVSKTVKDKDLEKVAKFLDWHFTDEGATMNTFGIKDVHYTIENGKPKYKPDYYGAANIGNRNKEGIWDGYIICGYIDQKTDGWPQVWDEQSIKYINSTIGNAFPKIVYFATPTGDSAGPEIDKTRQEIFTKILMGSISVDDGWNQWLKEFDRLGGNKWIKEVNDIYKTRK